MHQRDFPHTCQGKGAVSPVTVTAGGAADGVEQNGIVIDRMALGGGRALGAKLTLAALLNITDGDTASLSVVVSHGSDSSLTDEADLLTKDFGTIAAPSGANLVDGPWEGTFDIDLKGAKQYIRIDFTITLSAAATDTAAIAGTLTFGGFDEIPAE